MRLRSRRRARSATHDAAEEEILTATAETVEATTVAIAANRTTGTETGTVALQDGTTGPVEETAIAKGKGSGTGTTAIGIGTVAGEGDRPDLAHLIVMENRGAH